MTSPDDPRTGKMSGREQVPITVLATERDSVDLLQRLAADEGNFLIASDETLASAGVLGLVRVGRALVTAADVTSRTPGCECCQVRVDLIEAVRHAVLRRSAPKRLVVVVDPASDVVTCIHTLQADSEVERLARLDGLVVEVDACAVSTRLACGLDLWSGQTEASLAIADRIVVTGAESLTTSARAAVIHELRTVNRIGRIVSGVPIGPGVDGLVDLDAWDQAPPTMGRGSDTGPAAAIDTIVLTRDGVLDPDATDAWLDQIIAEAPSRLLRFQAAFCVSNREPRVCVRGSRSVMRSQPELRAAATSPSDPRGDRDSVVVLIGRGFDRCSLDEGFRSIETTR